MASTINADTSNGVIITPDTSGEIELQANGVTKAKVTANGLQDANGNSLRGGSFRNLIINGDMNIAQRGTTPTTGFEYLIDRWKQVRVLSSATVEMSQSTDVPTAQGFYNSIKLNVTSAGALSAGNYHRIDQRIEGQNLQHIKWGTASPEKLTLSFWVKSNYTGTFLATLNPASGASNSINFTVNSADTWEKKTLTFTDTTSTAPIPNDNTSGLQLYFYTASGASTFTETLNNYINITGVQLEVGEGASDFEFLPYDVQLQRCQRYYQEFRTGNTFYTSGVQTWRWIDQFFNTMRSTPTITVTDINGTTTINQINSTSVERQFTSGGAGTTTLRADLSVDSEL